MTKLKKNAFGIFARCAKTYKAWGISVNPMGNNEYQFVYGFKINEHQVSSEGFQQNKVHGTITYAPDFNGCPYCGSTSFVQCGKCGKFSCYEGKGEFKCPHCGNTGSVDVAEEFDISGGGY